MRNGQSGRFTDMEDTTERQEAVQEHALTIHADIAAKLNFAAHQCAFPVLRSLEVENPDADTLFEDLVLTLESDPAFLRTKKWPLDRIDPGGRIRIRNRDLDLDGAFLLERNEKMTGTLAFRLEKDGVPLAELRKPVELLAYNEWGGAGFMPELLPAFCMPNDPAVDAILRDASQVLRQGGQGGSDRRVRVEEPRARMGGCQCHILGDRQPWPDLRDFLPRVSSTTARRSVCPVASSTAACSNLSGHGPALRCVLRAGRTQPDRGVAQRIMRWSVSGSSRRVCRRS